MTTITAAKETSSSGSEMPGCDVTCLHYFGSDIEADQPTLRCIT